MDWLIELLELLNSCSANRAGAYMFFITVLIYVTISKFSSGITDIIFVLRGYSKPSKNKKDEDTM